MREEYDFSNAQKSVCKKLKKQLTINIDCVDNNRQPEMHWN